MATQEDIQAQAARIKEHKKIVGQARDAQWQRDRRGMRWHARHQLLVYALLRGTPYRRVEAKCHEAPSVAALLGVLGVNATGPDDPTGLRRLLVSRIDAWLAAPLREAA